MMSHFISEIRHGGEALKKEKTIMAARINNPAVIIPEVALSNPRVKRIIYWISTQWLASGMLSTGIWQLFRMKAEGAVAPPGVEGITHLGYPVYFSQACG